MATEDYFKKYPDAVRQAAARKLVSMFLETSKDGVATDVLALLRSMVSQTTAELLSRTVQEPFLLGWLDASIGNHFNPFVRADHRASYEFGHRSFSPGATVFSDTLCPQCYTETSLSDDGIIGCAVCGWCMPTGFNPIS